MHSNEFLYGEDVEVPELDALVITRRIELLKDNLELELEKPYMQRSTYKIIAIEKAIRWWENMSRGTTDV